MIVKTLGVTNTFFAADHHIFHDKIIEYCARPFKTQDDQINALIEEHNKVVGRGDRVIFLGDLFFHAHKNTSTQRSKWGGQASDKDRRLEIISAMNGQKFLIRGNHDFPEKWPENVQGVFGWIRDIHPALRVKSHDQTFFLCHYPLITWPGYKRGVILLHGHVHSADPLAYRLATRPSEIEDGHHRVELWRRSLDVGVDGHAYKPWSVDQIQEVCEQYP